MIHKANYCSQILRKCGEMGEEIKRKELVKILTNTSISKNIEILITITILCSPLATGHVVVAGIYLSFPIAISYCSFSHQALWLLLPHYLVGDPKFCSSRIKAIIRLVYIVLS